MEDKNTGSKENSTTIFENVYSGHWYYIELVYTFNANTVNDHTICTTQYDILTTTYNVSASIDNVVADYDSVTFDVNIEDEHNRVTNVNIQLVDYYDNSKVYQDIEYTGNGTYSFENLYSSKKYRILITVEYDINSYYTNDTY